MTERLGLPIAIIMFVLAFGAISGDTLAGDVAGPITNNTIEQHVRLPQGCTPGQIAVATGSGDDYRWICGDLP